MNVIIESVQYLKLLRKYNTLETKYELLKELQKNKCFEILLEKVGEPLEVKRLREENKRLRLRIKELKKELVEVSSKK